MLKIADHNNANYKTMEINYINDIQYNNQQQSFHFQL